MWPNTSPVRRLTIALFLYVRGTRDSLHELVYPNFDHLFGCHKSCWNSKSLFSERSKSISAAEMATKFAQKKPPEVMGQSKAHAKKAA
ncbi:hypothetical protein [Oligoflexus tunisiensis]|uniref:hypothetical protein n=1 Tax=Oligoflexus tunisiensis TaxID=708132 RepID=UPI001C407420|nr:hypothetical protein [Oligoflexus tunisiensis]